LRKRQKLLAESMLGGHGSETDADSVSLSKATTREYLKSGLAVSLCFKPSCNVATIPWSADRQMRSRGYGQHVDAEVKEPLDAGPVAASARIDRCPARGQTAVLRGLIQCNNFAVSKALAAGQANFS
jgi:hypothetical protein